MYGELASRKRSISRRHLHFKDICKRDMKATEIDTNIFEQLAGNRLSTLDIREARKTYDRMQMGNVPEGKRSRVNLKLIPSSCARSATKTVILAWVRLAIAGVAQIRSSSANRSSVTIGVTIFGDHAVFILCL